MAKENTKSITGTDLLHLKRRGMESCFKCQKSFKILDKITTVTVSSHSTSRSRTYHKECWEKVLQ